MGVATSTGNHSNSTSPHRNKAPTRLVTGPSKNWGWNRSTPLSITSAPPPCCGSQGSQQPSGGNPTFSTIFGSFFLLWQRAQKKGVERFHPPLQYHPNAFNIADFKVASNLASMFSRSMRTVRFFASKTNFPVCPPLLSKRSSCFCFEGGGTVPPPSVSRLKTSPAGSFCLSSCISFDFARTPSGSR